MIEKNVEIAKMLGWKRIKDLEEINEENEDIKDYWFLNNSEAIFWSDDMLKFHSDGNWLFEALEFVESKGFNTFIGSPSMTVYHYMNIPLENSIMSDKPSKVMGKGATKKEAIFDAIYKFAKMYNNNEIQKL